MHTEKNGTGPLSGLRVIELGAFIAGPFCGQLLADLGADVIKVEPPGIGDPMRQWGIDQKSGHSMWWAVIGRNKRSITLDLRRPEAQAIARRLIKTSDSLIENFKPGVLEKWNLDPEELRREHPDLVVARISGFGQVGPYRDRPGFGSVAESMGGLRHLTGDPDRRPIRAGVSIGDSLSGVFAALGVVSALYARQKKGHTTNGGQTVDVAITDSVLAVLESVIAEYSATKKIRQRSGSILPGVAPSNLYPTGDKSWVLIAANADGLFRKLAEAIGCPELGSDPRFATHQARASQQAELDRIITEWSSIRTRDEILALLCHHGVPSGPLYDAADIANDPHFRERGAVVDVETAEFGPLSMQGVVPKLSQTPGKIRWSGPVLGQHNDEVYRGILGFSGEDLAKLQAEGVI
jgi:crotonobetainyl-CoA:carnitine CoA-transferase CaiB-like acyl-CoA transferase